MPPDAALPSPRLSDSNAPGYRIQEALICQFTFFSNAPGVDPFPPFAQMQDGTLVHARAGIGGMSEIMTAFEEYCVPVFTDLTAAELTLLGDQLASGFAAGHSRMVFEPGSDVAVFGAGPVGLGAIQAGRVMGGAGQVIAIDPIRYRRELALTPGATIALDPSVEGDGIVERVRELCRGQRSPVRGRHDVGTRRQRRHGTRGRLRRRGAGLQALPPKVEAKPDPANVKTVQQAWDCTRMGGQVMLMGFTLQPVPFPGATLALLGRTIHPGQQGGLHAMRDIPRYVKLIEKGRIDARSLITRRYTLEQGRQAVQDTADRTIITGVIEFS